MKCLPSWRSKGAQPIGCEDEQDISSEMVWLGQQRAPSNIVDNIFELY